MSDFKPPRKDFIHSAHMEVLRPDKFKLHLRLAKKKFREAKLDFDAIAFSGMSGAVFAPYLAHILKKNMIMVRKGADAAAKGHSCFDVEGYTATERYVIVDDLISSGATAQYIHDRIEKDFANGAQCVGMYCYLFGEFRPSNDYRLQTVLYTTPSVPKIEEADDPTIERPKSPGALSADELKIFCTVPI